MRAFELILNEGCALHERRRNDRFELVDNKPENNFQFSCMKKKYKNMTPFAAAELSVYDDQNNFYWRRQLEIYFPTG
jgi:hypothetical protein